MSHFLDGISGRPRWRKIPLGHGAVVWLAWPRADELDRVAAVEDATLRAGLFGRLVIVSWEGVRVEPNELKWRPRPKDDGTLPFSAMNAALLYIRAGTVRATVDAALARWKDEHARSNGDA